MRTFLQRGFRPAICLILFGLLVFTLMPPSAHAMPVFINELHYDNAGADVGEGVELVGTAGANLQGWRLWFYNGGNGQSYNSLTLSGIFTDQQNGYGVLAFAFVGIQNGSPDGVALVDASNQLQQFISYEGAFTAQGGVAANVLSEDIGVAENSSTAIGDSLQLTGTDLADYQWQVGVSSFGSVNALQQFNRPAVSRNLLLNSVAITPTWLLLTLGLLGVAVNARDEKGVVTV